MKSTPLLMALGAVALAGPGTVTAQRGGHPAAMPMIHTPTTVAPTTAPATHMSQGATQGTGWNHMNGPTHATGQPNASCGSASAPTTPGNAGSAPGSAFNPTGQAGSVYAGQQPQNSRNTASVSQYDSACLHHN
ncbi:MULTISPECIES: hypothetical protein [unclassified Sphingomonas]|jgi:hypothetical protein|uniref:hypothetical protein n=1 Tax=unclassified Sphingomonas TaxID=196159 RepID=UPI000925F8AE|nr:MULTISPECIES: hypothetical protein [unclassified Sphingomonas]OJU19216.1 MAG: hypothetical protein BGN95_20800 [Sphingomonas sp. 66-10]